MKLGFSSEALVLNFPKKETNFNESEWWVWAGFVKPGKHNVVIRGPNGGFFRRNIGVPVRKGEIDGLKYLTSSYFSSDQSVKSDLAGGVPAPAAP